MPYRTVEDAVSRAVTSRPEVAVALHQERAAKYGRTASDLDWLPTVDGRFTWSYNENTGFSDDKDMWQLVIKADWVLWDGGARIAQQQKSASQRRMATLAAQRAQQTAEEEVRGAYSAWQAADSALRSVERELALAKENQRLAEVGFTAGTLSFLEVEDARVGLLSAELGVLQTRCDRDLAAWKVLKATGDL
jgi:outer membrane protein TolC